MNHLDFKAAVGELKAAVDYLRSTGSKKVAGCAHDYCVKRRLIRAAGRAAPPWPPYMAIPAILATKYQRDTGLRPLTTDHPSSRRRSASWASAWAAH
jgi:hypothetical protein